jgi:hypothetical protein
MNAQSVFNAVQSITGIAVVVGLALVIYQLRQDREFTRVQQANDAYAAYGSSVRSGIGEKGAEAWAVACDEPDGLSTEQMIVMSRMLTDQLNRVRAVYTRQMIAEDLISFDWKSAVPGNFGAIFSTEFGRWWWSTQQHWEPEIVRAGNDYLRDNEIMECRSYYDLYRSRNDL